MTMSEYMPSSKEFLKNSIQSHAELAKDLLKLTDTDSGEAYNRFQVASIIIFLAGLEKMLNIAFGLLYIAGKVKWKEIVYKSSFKTKAGFTDCHRGLYGKIKELEKLGVDITLLMDIVEMRNYFVHDSFIYAGYAQVVDKSTMTARISPVGPQISYPLSPSIVWTDEIIQYYTDGTLNVVSSFVDTTDWKRAWWDISEKLKELPIHEIDVELVHDPDGHEKIMARIEELNNKYIGIGLQKLL